MVPRREGRNGDQRKSLSSRTAPKERFDFPYASSQKIGTCKSRGAALQCFSQSHERLFLKHRRSHHANSVGISRTKFSYRNSPPGIGSGATQKMLSLPVKGEIICKRSQRTRCFFRDRLERYSRQMTLIFSSDWSVNEHPKIRDQPTP